MIQDSSKRRESERFSAVIDDQEILDALDETEFVEDELADLMPEEEKMMTKKSLSDKEQEEIKMAVPEQVETHEYEVEMTDEKHVILLDMDAYYAQVEMKKHNVDRSKPCALVQWNSLIALSYAAKNQGVKRGMNVYEAMAVLPTIILIHVSTFEVIENGPVTEQSKRASKNSAE